jgi:site-specific DNA-adenine methylase
MVTSRKIAAIPRYGGKFRQARYIVPVIEAMPHKTYIEPCVGGASVFLGLVNPTTTLVLNDANSCLLILYKLMQCYPDALLTKLSGIPFSRLVYQQAKFNLATCDIFDDSFENQLTIAADTYVSLCMSFGNVMGDDGGWRVDKKRGSDPRTWRNRKLNLRHAIDRIDSVYIDCADYATVSLDGIRLKRYFILTRPT